MREFLNSVLASIGAESLTDDEYDSISATIAAYNQETYDDLARILEEREAVSDTQERLKYHYIENGFEVATNGTGRSNIFIGGGVNDANTFPANPVTGPITPGRVVVSNGRGFSSASSITSDELSALDNISSNIQEQFDALESVTDDLQTQIDDIPGGGGSGSAISENTTTQSISDNGAITLDSGESREIVYVKGNAAPVTGVTLPDCTEVKELFIIGDDDTNTLELDFAAPNVILDGPIVFRTNTSISLLWCMKRSAYVEMSRNAL